MTLKRRQPPTGVATSYLTRRMPLAIRDRIKVLSITHPTLKTMEAVVNRALEIGLPQLEAERTTK